MTTTMYEKTLKSAQRANWRIEDVLGDGDRLDFSRPFLPESLARVEEQAFLSKDERRILNQIRGNAYLNIFGLVEEFILPFVMDHVRPGLAADDWRTRAMLQFAGTTVDGETSAVYPPLLESDVRY